jgi:hypothetical protein
MKGEIMNTRNHRLRGALVAGALAAIAVGVTAAPAFADTWVYGSPGYYYAPSTTVYTPAPAYYYTERAYVYPRRSIAMGLASIWTRRS